MIYGTHHTYEPQRDEAGRVTDSLASGTFRDLPLVVEECAGMLRLHVDRFDTIVATGVSGMAVAFPLAVALRKRVAILRKRGDDSHSFNDGDWQGRTDVRGRNCLWVDDFMCSGETQQRIEDATVEAEGTPVGTLLYAGRTGCEPPDLTFHRRGL